MGGAILACASDITLLLFKHLFYVKSPIAGVIG